MKQEYSELKAMNWSSLRHMDVSGLAFKWSVEHPREDMPYFSFGRIAHLAILQPELFDETCVKRPDQWDSWRTKASKEWKEKQLEQGKEIITDEDARVVTFLRKNFFKHPCSNILENTKKEEVITWHDKGVYCKARVDAISADRLIELKTTHSLSHFVRRGFFSYLYHGQIAWYLDGAIESGFCNDKTNVYIIACETNPPYDVAIFRVSDEIIRYGRRLKARLFDTWIACKDASVWPGQYPNITVLEPPYWYRDEDVDDEDIGDE